MITTTLIDGILVLVHEGVIVIAALQSEPSIDKSNALHVARVLETSANLPMAP